MSTRMFYKEREADGACKTDREFIWAFRLMGNVHMYLHFATNSEIGEAARTTCIGKYSCVHIAFLLFSNEDS